MNIPVSIGTTARFHSFDLARQLLRRGRLGRVYSAYPVSRLVGEEIPREFLRTHPVGYVAARAVGKVLPDSAAARVAARASTAAFARAIAKDVQPETVYSGMSGTSLEPGLRAQRLGGYFVCRRGSSHIETQDELLREEHDKWGVPYTGIDPWVIERELAEYASADLIEVPSTFAASTFSRHGIDESKMLVAPLGVDLKRFAPSSSPAVGRFDVLFVAQVSLRKGIPYVLEAFAGIDHPRKTLTVVGAPNPSLLRRLRDRGISTSQVRFLGTMPQSELVEIFSRSHVLVLPSVEDGFGMVMAQAMACGCPVVASTSTGAKELFGPGQGWTVPPASAEALRDQLQRIADDESMRLDVRSAALTQVSVLGGWDSYGDAFLSGIERLGA